MDPSFSVLLSYQGSNECDNLHNQGEKGNVSGLIIGLSIGLAIGLILLAALIILVIVPKWREWRVTRRERGIILKERSRELA